MATMQFIEFPLSGNSAGGSIVTANQGNPAPLSDAWPVKLTDGVIVNTFDLNGLKVSASQSGLWNITNITGTISLPTGAATEATLSAINLKTPISTVSAGNSTITPLAGAASFTGTGEDITPYIATSILLVTDQNGSLIPEYSNNNINWDETETYPIIVTTPGVSQSFAFSFMAEAQYFRVKYTNGATPQGNFKVQTVLNVNAPSGEIHPISSALSTRMEALVTKGLIYGLTSGGAYVAVRVNTQGAMTSDVVGFTRANAPTRNDYTSVNVTTAAYVQLVASMTSATKEIEIFDSSGQTMMLATGAAASEVDQMLIFPGGNGRVKLAIPAGTRVSVKAVSATASVGELSINWYA